MRATRIVLMIMFVALLPSLVIAAGDIFEVGEIKIDVTVAENIGFPKETIKVSIFPGETKQEWIELVNSDSVDSAVTLELRIEPDDGGVTVSVPGDVVVPANGSFDLILNVNASGSAAPGKYDVTITIFRKES